MDPHLACGVPHFIDALSRSGVSNSGSTSGISCDNCNSVVNGQCERGIHGVNLWRVGTL